MKIFIITEGGKSIGYGHIARCISLCQAFEEKGQKATLLVNGDDSAASMLTGRDFQIVDWMSGKEELFARISGADIAVVDSYYPGIDFYEHVSRLVKVPVYLDDTGRIDYSSGVVVNGNIFAKDLQYAGKGPERYLLGTEYTPLRKPFWDVPERATRGSIDNILVTLGGSESAELLTMLVGFICRKFPLWKKNVVVGGGLPYKERIEKVKDGRTHIFHNAGEETMKDLMMESDIAITSGGQTLYELARIGVPAIAFSIADNQVRNIRGLERSGALMFAGSSADADLPDSICAAVESLMPKEARYKLSMAGRGLIDGNGSRRIRDCAYSLAGVVS